jgi:hypothetical protein
MGIIVCRGMEGFWQEYPAIAFRAEENKQGNLKVNCNTHNYHDIKSL